QGDVTGVRDPVGRSLASPPFAFLGESSYALYLVHVPLYGLSTFVAVLVGTSLAGWPAWVALVAGSIAVAGIVFVLVERPARAALRRRLGVERKQVALRDAPGIAEA